MRIAVVTDTFTRRMGYTENLLPKALVDLGHEVHVIVSNLQGNHASPDYADVYEDFQGPAVQQCGAEQIDGFTVHRLPHRILGNYVWLKGFVRAVQAIRPDVVQALAVQTWPSIEAAMAKPLARYELFIGAHQTASVMPKAVLGGPRLSRARLRSDLQRAVPGRLVSLCADKCYAATPDCAEVARRFYGVPGHKIEICALGCDTSRFWPVRDASSGDERAELRARFGFAGHEILCVYTGKFFPGKDPACLARAIAILREEGHTYRGLFVGAGPQAGEIAAQPGCVVHPFVPWHELPSFYRAADIGVWPRQESMSMIDAAACGIPVVVSDRLKAIERVEGNGLQYREGDARALANALLELSDPDTRAKLGLAGAAKVAHRFSWRAIAERRVEDYERALG